MPTYSPKNTRGIVGARMPIKIVPFHCITKGLWKKEVKGKLWGREERKLGDLAFLPSSSSSPVSEDEMPTLAKTNCYACAKQSLPSHKGPCSFNGLISRLAFNLSFTTKASPPHKNVHLTIITLMTMSPDWKFTMFWTFSSQYFVCISLIKS